jgi:hypothetical protein
MHFSSKRALKSPSPVFSSSAILLVSYWICSYFCLSLSLRAGESSFYWTPLGISCI